MKESFYVLKAASEKLGEDHSFLFPTDLSFCQCEIGQWNHSVFFALALSKEYQFICTQAYGLNE